MICHVNKSTKVDNTIAENGTQFLLEADGKFDTEKCAWAQEAKSQFSETQGRKKKKEEI